MRLPLPARSVLWTNGGPGCSGLIGFFTEQGPFQSAPDSKTLMANPNAWNQVRWGCACLLAQT